MIREVLKMGDLRLLEKSQPVEAFGTPQLRELIADMRDMSQFGFVEVLFPDQEVMDE